MGILFERQRKSPNPQSLTPAVTSTLTTESWHLVGVNTFFVIWLNNWIYNKKEYVVFTICHTPRAVRRVMGAKIYVLSPWDL